MAGCASKNIEVKPPLISVLPWPTIQACNALTSASPDGGASAAGRVDGASASGTTSTADGCFLPGFNLNSTRSPTWRATPPRTLSSKRMTSEGRPLSRINPRWPSNLRTTPATRPGAGASRGGASSPEDAASAEDSSASSSDDVSSAFSSSGGFAHAAIMPARPPSCDRCSGFAFVDGAGSGALSRTFSARARSASAQCCEQ